MKELMAGRRRGKVGAGEKGSLGKADILKTETLKGKMPRTMPESGGTGRVHRYFVCR